jgi:hypothetical protein
MKIILPGLHSSIILGLNISLELILRISDVTVKDLMSHLQNLMEKLLFLCAVILLFYELVEKTERFQLNTLPFPEFMILEMHPKIYLQETFV